MHDIKANYDKIVEIVETFFKNEMDSNGNFRFCPNPPRMPNKQALAGRASEPAGQMDITGASVRDTGFPNDIRNGGQDFSASVGVGDLYCGLVSV